MCGLLGCVPESFVGGASRPIWVSACAHLPVCSRCHLAAAGLDGVKDGLWKDGTATMPHSLCGTLPSWDHRFASVDTLGFEPRAFCM